MALPNPLDNPPVAKNRDNPRKGPHYARVVGIADLGTQPEFVWQGKTQPAAPKVEITFELPGSLMEDGRPHWVSKKVGVSWNVSDNDPAFTSGLMRIVLAVNPDEEVFDAEILNRILDGTCQVTVSINEKGYANVAAVSGIPFGTPVGELKNPVFNFDWATASKAQFDALRSPMTKKAIQNAVNYATSPLKARIDGLADAAYDEDMPF